MSKQRVPEPNAPDPLPYLAWCPKCGLCVPFNVEGLARFIRDGWPQCCGREMLCHTPHRTPDCERAQ
jgi:hypothetical protein